MIGEALKASAPDSWIFVGLPPTRQGAQKRGNELCKPTVLQTRIAKTCPRSTIETGAKRPLPGPLPGRESAAPLFVTH